MSNETTNKFALINFPDIPDSVDNAAKNLTDKPTHNIGTTFGDLWFLVFGGISHKADKRRMKYAASLESYKTELETAFSKIPEDKKVEPSTQVVAQALEHSKYCIEEQDLRSMFVSLVTNSMNSDYSRYIHPSFAEIIKQMSPFDAKVMQCFKHNLQFPICEYQKEITNTSYRVLADDVCLGIFPDEPYRVSQALSSLQRFGLVSISYDKQFHDDSKYKIFTEDLLYQALKKQAEPNKILLSNGIVTRTSLGYAFAVTCIPD